MKKVHIPQRLLITFLTVLSLCLPAIGQAKSIALSFDDGLDPRSQPMAASWNSSILTALSKAQVTSILFAAGKRVDSPAGLRLVKDWGNAGHVIANHTYSHANFGSKQVTLEQFIADTEKNEVLLKGIPGWTKRFRFPYLKEGETASKRDGFKSWLTNHGYKSGAVSVDASDWYYNKRYLEWIKAHPDEDVSSFRTAYLKHLWNRTMYYDSLSEKTLKRSVKHIILLHTNAINAAFLPDIITMYKSNGWEIISPDSAYEDPLYAMELTGLPAGESILWALAKQQGVNGLRYPAESDEYEKPLMDKLGL
ncbi:MULTISPECIES: polysaccharide deacetylase family protein [unclassified Pseudodesulfovibrio]|uniref:polysaccharide deacetylase family protein n=1 Tax=unclassified Pseudodesulfovibrio TaxID=2661612 RepID=UPI000FEBEB77|nr:MULTISPECIES: polysaccharide deacetylase family protein [unclassified Pseudodesulfovibrio]MCJ2165244.1 polysaccharide deacetylase family protein [Pseudodesulfovibrio sp. S3-i]RWU03296.1 polysaccharide deacetylase [Pseudodesulfovibrio sp. S3]